MTTETARWRDRYGALEQGVIDAAVHGFDSATKASLYEVTKYVIDHPFGGTSTSMIINLDTWNSLPKHLQDVLMEAAIWLEGVAAEWVR